MTDSAREDAATELTSLSVALFGFFNPPIFDQHWFVAQSVFDVQEASAAETDVRDSHLLLMTVSDMVLEVSADRFAAYSSDPTRFDRIHEIVDRTFAVLEHTPVWAVGIQREHHFALPEGVARAVLSMVSPELGLEFVVGPGVTDAVSVQLAHPAREGAHLRVEVESSEEVSGGLYVGIIEEAELPEARAASRGCAGALAALDELWEGSEGRAERILGAIKERIKSV
jgi:hypothetical protein